MPTHAHRCARACLCHGWIESSCDLVVEWRVGSFILAFIKHAPHTPTLQLSDQQTRLPLLRLRSESAAPAKGRDGAREVAASHAAWHTTTATTGISRRSHCPPPAAGLSCCDPRLSPPAATSTPPETDTAAWTGGGPHAVVLRLRASSDARDAQVRPKPMQSNLISRSH